MLKSLLAGISDALIPSAYAGIGGVAVTLKTTGQSATTDDTGFFVISGVPAGDHEIVFRYGQSEATYSVSVQDNVRVELNDVRVTSAGTVTVRNVVVVQLGETAAEETVTPRRDSQQTTATTTTTTTITTTNTTTTTQPHTGGEMPF